MELSSYFPFLGPKKVKHFLEFLEFLLHFYLKKKPLYEFKEKLDAV